MTLLLVSAISVLAAIVLLVAGTIAAVPSLVVASIFVSIVAAGFLLIGAMLQGKELFSQLAPREPDLEEQLASIAARLSRDARKLSEIQAGIRARAAMAERLKAEAEANRKHAEATREQAEAERAAAEAVEDLLKASTNKMADYFDRRLRKSQIIFLVVGALLGGIVGVGCQQLYDLLV